MPGMSRTCWPIYSSSSVPWWRYVMMVLVSAQVSAHVLSLRASAVDLILGCVPGYGVSLQLKVNVQALNLRVAEVWWVR